MYTHTHTESHSRWIQTLILPCYYIYMILYDHNYPMFITSITPSRWKTYPVFHLFYLLKVLIVACTYIHRLSLNLFLLWLCRHQDSGFPCFKGGVRTIQNLRKRFHLSLTEEVSILLLCLLAHNILDVIVMFLYFFGSNVSPWCFLLLAVALMLGGHGSMIIIRGFWMEYCEIICYWW
jgi:hypothetical protein